MPDLKWASIGDGDGGLCECACLDTVRPDSSISDHDKGRDWASATGYKTGMPLQLRLKPDNVGGAQPGVSRASSHESDPATNALPPNALACRSST